MSLPFRAAVAALALVSASAAAQTPSPAAGSAKSAMPPAPTTDLVVAGRKLANWILANQIDSVVMNAGSGVNADTARMELGRFVEDLAIRGGNELKVVEEKVVRRNGAYQYWRTAEFERAPSTVLFRIVVTPDGKYAGFGIGLANNPPPIDP
jgi:hypothetical protein